MKCEFACGERANKCGLSFTCALVAGHATVFITRNRAGLAPQLVSMLRANKQWVDPNLALLAAAAEEAAARLASQSVPPKADAGDRQEPGPTRKQTAGDAPLWTRRGVPVSFSASRRFALDALRMYARRRGLE